MIYVCLDTCVYVAMFKRDQKGCDAKVRQELKSLLESGKAVLLLPEVVRLELNKVWEGLRRGVKKHFGQLPGLLEGHYKIAEAIPAAFAEETADDLGRAIAKAIEETHGSFDAKIKALWEEVLGLFSPKYTKVIPLDNDVLLRVKKRQIAQSHPVHDPPPKPDRRGQTQAPTDKRELECDLAIIESLVFYFQQHPDDQAAVFFCTNNTRDFALNLGSNEEPQWTLHPSYLDEFPKRFFFTSLDSLVQALKGEKTPEQPTPEQVEKALEREKAEASATEQVIMHTVLDAMSEAGATLTLTTRAELPEQVTVARGLTRLVRNIVAFWTHVKAEGGYTREYYETKLMEIGESLKKIGEDMTRLRMARIESVSRAALMLGSMHTLRSQPEQAMIALADAQIMTLPPLSYLVTKDIQRQFPDIPAFMYD